MGLENTGTSAERRHAALLTALTERYGKLVVDPAMGRVPHPAIAVLSGMKTSVGTTHSRNMSAPWIDLQIGTCIPTFEDVHSECTTTALQPAIVAGVCRQGGGAVSNLITRGVRTHGGHRSSGSWTSAPTPSSSPGHCRPRTDGPVDARRQPHQVAPRAHHVVLRDFRAAPACPGYRSFDPAYEYLSTPITKPSVRATRPQRGMLTRPGLHES